MPLDQLPRSGSVDFAASDAAVAAEQTRLLLHNPADVPISLLNAALVGVVVWPLYPRWVIGLWVASICVVSVHRALLRHRYTRASSGEKASPHWTRELTQNVFVAGCLWGLSASVILETPDPVYYSFIVFVLGGMMAGGAVTNAVNLRAVLAFIVPTILPVIVALTVHGGLVQIEMAMMLFLFTGALVWTGRNINRSMTENVRLRSEQEVFVGVLRSSQATSVSLAAIVDASGDAIYAETLAGTILSWNKGAERLLGYRAEEAIGQSVRIIVPEERREEMERILAALADGKRIDPFDTVRLRKDGTRVSVSVAVSLTLDAKRSVVGASIIARDIGERQVAAHALAYRERLLHAVTIGTGILVKADSLEQAMSESLRVLGETLLVDRVLVMGEGPGDAVSGTLPVLRHLWQLPGTKISVDPSAFVFAPADRPAMAAWHAPLSANKPVETHLATSHGPVKVLLERLQIQSSLMVPIFDADRLWGTLGLDSCRRARQWMTSEIDTLRSFGEIVGSLIRNDEARRSLARSEERFRTVTATAQDAIIMIDGAARIGLWNRAAERILGYSVEEAIGKQAHDLLTPLKFRARADAGMKVFLATGRGDLLGKTTQLAALRKDGTEIAVELSLAAARLDDCWGAIGVLRDVTERKNAEDKLQFANLLLQTQMEASPDGILIVAASNAIVAFNQLFATIWNVPLADLMAGADATVLARVASSVKDTDRFKARVQFLYDHPGEDGRDELETTDGRSIDRYTVTLNSPLGVYLGRAWFFRDITERKRAEALALRMARYDVLTGLANRAVFVEALQYAIATAKRGEKSFAVVYLDLDHFKDVNDTLGHPVGDELLKAVADRLRANTREIDTVARFGGDEFAIVVADIRDPADAAALALKLISAFALPFSVQGNEIHSGASMGIAAYSFEAADAETLLAQADVALYRAKSEGRGGYRFFTDTMNSDVQTRVALGADLRIALDQGQLFLLYQPQVAIDTGRITGVEALVQWRHPRRGILGPDLFTPIAEQIGIIAKLGHWVLREACRQGEAWLKDGIAPARIAVNVSALQFRTPIALEADIATVLAQTGLPPRMLELELTESVLRGASRKHSDLLQRLRKTGVAVAIDAFGAGYSSLEYLHAFPSSRIKITRNFVTHLETAPGDAAVVRASINLARELKTGTIAEGVETRAQYDLLKQWGCSEVQGVLLAQPLTAEDAGAALRAGTLLPS